MSRFRRFESCVLIAAFAAVASMCKSMGSMSRITSRAAVGVDLIPPPMPNKADHSTPDILDFADAFW